MIGNDVIDLEFARDESNWKRNGYLDKIFTPKEQLMIAAAENPDIGLWSLWSRKEASYKIYHRETGRRVFNPTYFECSSLTLKNGVYDGEVRTQNATYYTQTKIVDDYIHSVAVVDNRDFTKVSILKNRTAIVKVNGCPNFIDGSNRLNPASISHHGKFETIVALIQSQF